VTDSWLTRVTAWSDIDSAHHIESLVRGGRCVP